MILIFKLQVGIALALRCLALVKAGAERTYPKVVGRHKTWGECQNIIQVKWQPKPFVPITVGHLSPLFGSGVMVAEKREIK